MFFRHLQFRWEARIKVKWNKYSKGQCIHDAMKSIEDETQLVYQPELPFPRTGQEERVFQDENTVCAKIEALIMGVLGAVNREILLVWKCEWEIGTGALGRVVRTNKWQNLKDPSVYTCLVSIFPPVCKREPLQSVTGGEGGGG